MYRKFFLSFILLFLFTNLRAQSTGEISIAQRHSIESELLEETRFYNVYLPPSYVTHPDASYPVLYMMDGDYNFFHMVGLIEQMAGIGQKIPEMIIVGIADNGHEKYVQNCTPKSKDNSTGQSGKFARFLTEELRKSVAKEFRTADYNILVGHSLGGLFVINTLLETPESFDAYIAISPSLWWGDYEAEGKVKDFFKDHERLNRFLFLSLANEKGMGVHGFYDELDKHTFMDQYMNNAPLGLDYTFMEFPEENHNSVGLITVKHALQALFPDYNPKESDIEQCTNFAEFEKLILSSDRTSEKTQFLPMSSLRTFVNHLYEANFEELSNADALIQKKYPGSIGDFRGHLANAHIHHDEIGKARLLLEALCKQFPQNPEYFSDLASAYEKSDMEEKAKASYKRAYIIAQEIGMRQWYLNELRSKTLEK